MELKVPGTYIFCSFFRCRLQPGGDDGYWERYSGKNILTDEQTQMKITIENKICDPEELTTCKSLTIFSKTKCLSGPQDETH